MEINSVNIEENKMIPQLRNASKAVLGVAILVCSAAAQAHVGHDTASGFMSGLLHPVTGLDHMIVILGVGILAAQMRAGVAWALPIAFLVTMTVVAALTATGANWAWAEYGVAASMLAVGVALAFRIRGPLLATVGMVTLFAAFHGYLHGAEAAAGARAEFLSGMLFATATLHTLGFAIGRATALDRICRYGGVTIVTIALFGSV